MNSDNNDLARSVCGNFSLSLFLSLCVRVKLASSLTSALFCQRLSFEPETN